MRRLLTGVLAVAILASLFQATAVARPHDHQHYLLRQCRFERLDDRGGYTTAEVARTIRCATWRWYRGHITTVLCIAHRESGENLSPAADNPSSSASGVFQILDSTWDSWTAEFADRREMFGLSPSVWDARSNVMTSLFRMGAGGLDPWGGGC